MMRLYAHMYIRWPRFEPSHLFGLSDDQCRERAVIETGEWFNSRGEKLGQGALDGDDLHRIAQELEADEMFIITSTGTVHEPAHDPDLPGMDYLFKTARFVVIKGIVYFIPTWEERPRYVRDDQYVYEGQCVVTVWSREQFKALHESHRLKFMSV